MNDFKNLVEANANWNDDHIDLSSCVTVTIEIFKPTPYERPGLSYSHDHWLVRATDSRGRNMAEIDDKDLGSAMNKVSAVLVKRVATRG